MNNSQIPYRELHDAFLDQTADLDKWLVENPQEVQWLADFQERPGSPIPPATATDLAQLYALSRILQVLAMPQQPGLEAMDAWTGPRIEQGEATQFAEELGLMALTPSTFHPFSQEIVSVESREGPVTIEEVLWPCLMLGPLLVRRAGVRISAPRRLMDPNVASNSTLYWAYRRRLRKAKDLSHGWGSNSQWRTSFRRDYRIEGYLHFNADGELDLTGDRPANPRFTSILADDGLTRAERIELLMHRCTLRVPAEEIWPWDDMLVVHEATPWAEVPNQWPAW